MQIDYFRITSLFKVDAHAVDRMKITIHILNNTIMKHSYECVYLYEYGHINRTAIFNTYECPLCFNSNLILFMNKGKCMLILCVSVLFILH